MLVCGSKMRSIMLRMKWHVVKEVLFRAKATLAILAAFISMSLWGVGPVLTKSALETFDSSVLIVIQLASCIAFFLVCGVISRAPLRPRKGYAYMSCLGLLQPGLGYTLRNIGMETTTASAAAFINSSEIFLVAVLSRLILRESTSVYSYFCILMSIIGVTIVITPNTLTSDTHFIAGDLWVLGGDFAAALFIVLSSRIKDDLSVLVVSLYQTGVSLVFCGFVLTISIITGKLSTSRFYIGHSDLVEAVISGLVEFGPAFWLYLFALRRLSPVYMTFLQSLIPIVALSISYLFLSESVSVIQLGGAIIVVLSLVASQAFPMHAAVDPS